jgi:hypothetical protein
MKFGRMLRKLREEKNISIARFAKSVGMSPTYLAPIERDVFPPPAESKVVRIARALDQDPDEFLALAGRIQRCETHHLPSPAGGELLRAIDGCRGGKSWSKPPAGKSAVGRRLRTAVSATSGEQQLSLRTLILGCSLLWCPGMTGHPVSPDRGSFGPTLLPRAIESPPHRRSPPLHLKNPIVASHWAIILDGAPSHRADILTWSLRSGRSNNLESGTGTTSFAVEASRGRRRIPGRPHGRPGRQEREDFSRASPTGRSTASSLIAGLADRVELRGGRRLYRR